MKNNRKGQAAMEFLMTYGWAILVVLAAIGALAYFGVLSPQRFLPNQCTIGQGFNCVEFKVGSDNIQMRVKNNLGTGVSDAEVTINGTGPDAGNTCNQSFGSTDNGADLGGGLQTYSCTPQADQYRGDIQIVYTRSGETVNHTVSGRIVSEVE